MIQLKFENKVPAEYKVGEKVFLPWFQKALAILNQFKDENGFIELNLVTEKEIAKFNKQYRKKNKSTDVLSFSFVGQERFPGENIVGQIIICPKIAKEQANERGVSWEDEIMFLFVHGMIHLAGYDHENPADFKKMFKIHLKIMPGRKYEEWVEALFKENFS